MTLARALVTGGLGFLGTHLVDTLLELQHEVWIIDDLSSSVVEASEYAGRCHLFCADLTRFQPPRDVSFDYLYHLADAAGPARILRHAGMIGPRSLAGLNAVMHLARPGHTRVVLVSSSEIYGRPGSYPEEAEAVIYTPYTVRLEYAVAKSLCEISGLNRARHIGVELNVVRPFNIAGPRQSPDGGFVVPRFFEAALAGRALTVFGDGAQVRSFTHVLDTVDSLIAVATSQTSGSIFNSGNPGNMVTISALAERVKELCGSPSPIKFVDPREIFGPLYAESFDKVPDTKKIERAVGWKAHRSLDQLLQDTLAYYLRTRAGTRRENEAADAGDHD